jgi:hypothetical protein
MFSPVALLRLSTCNKQMLVICICLPLSCFGFLATFCWWRFQGNTYLETQIPIDNWTSSRVKFYNSNLLSVLAMDYFLHVIVNCSESICQTYKSPWHRFCSPTNGSLLPNIQLVFGILHRWTSFLSFRQHVISLSPKEFDKPCLLSFSKWSKVIEIIELV